MEVASRNLFQATFTRSSLWWQVVVISAWSLLLVGVAWHAVPHSGAAGLAAAYAASWTASALLYLRHSCSPEAT
jgi:hypothetical protein